MLIDRPALLPLHPKLLHFPMFSSQVYPLMKRKINLAVWPVLENLIKSEGFLKGCPKYCFHRSWRSSTEKHYQSAWKSFDSWCFEKSEDPVSCPVNIVLEFLTDLFDKGLQYRTINTYRCAISVTHLPVDGCLIGSHSLVSKFMKGVFQSRPSCPRHLATWDVSVSLSYLRTVSPKEDLSLKEVTFKLTMLMALVRH